MADAEKPRTALGPVLALLAALCIEVVLIARAPALHSLLRLPATLFIIAFLHVTAVGVAATVTWITGAPRPPLHALVAGGAYIAIGIQLVFAGVHLEPASFRMAAIACAVFWTTTAIVLFGPLRVRLLPAFALSGSLTAIAALPVVLWSETIGLVLGLSR